MYMPTSDHTAFTTGLRERAEFKVEMNSMLFHSVINGIYADKIKAPFRELCTNARDGHAVAGNLDQPFDVQLPSHLDPVFSVRDYGCSLTHDEIMGLYSTMFASSKREDNLGVGMIGLGSKSPFAYTNIFSVTCWLDGRARHYSCFIGDNDVPQVALVDEEDSDEPDGVKVSFGVKPADVNKFRSLADEVLFGFDPKPNIANETFRFSEPEILFEGDGWTLYKQGTVPFTGPMARQGCVLYPINGAPLGLTDEPLFLWPCVIDFPIGELAVSTSREQLGYDENTRSNLTNRITKSKERMAVIVQDEIDACPTWMDACVLLHEKVQNKNPVWDLLKDTLAYKGCPLRRFFKTDEAGLQLMTLDPGRGAMGALRHHVGFRHTKWNWTYSANDMRDKVLIYHEPEKTKMAPARMRRAILENTGNKTILWVRGERPTIFGQKEILDLSKVEPLKLDKAKATPAPRSLKYFAPIRRFWRHDSSLKSEIVELKPELIYVEQQGRTFKINGNFLPLAEVHNSIFSLIQAKVLPAGTKVYCINKVNRKVLDEVQMTPLDDVIRENLREQLKTLSLSDISDHRRAQRSADVRSIRELQKGPLPADLEDYCKQVEDTDQTSQPTGSLVEMLRRYLPDEYNKAQQAAHPLVEAEARITEKYKMLIHILRLASYSDSRQKFFNHYMELCNK